MAVIMYPTDKYSFESGDERFANHAIHHTLFEFLRRDIEWLVPATQEALRRRAETMPPTEIDTNAHEFLAIDLMLVLITLSIADHKMVESELSLVSAICVAMEDNLRHSQSELYRAAWNAFTSEEYVRPYSISLLQDYYDSVHHTDFAAEARRFLSQWVEIGVEIDSEVTPEEKIEVAAFLSTLFQNATPCE